MRASDLSNFIGRTVLPFTNPRVVAPPGTPGHHGRPNLIVATPMRSGTHILIDLILNNLRTASKCRLTLWQHLVSKTVTRLFSIGSLRSFPLLFKL